MFTPELCRARELRYLGRMFPSIFAAFSQGGFQLSFITGMLAAGMETPAHSLSHVSALGLGFVLGLKHALEADHLAAVTTIVSERKSLLSSSLVGGVWGVGHTLSLLVAGVAVIMLHVRIGERTALALEFGVGLMLVLLGVNALRKLTRPEARIHLHTHRHGGWLHAHPHLHDGQPVPGTAGTTEATHHGFQGGGRPVLSGVVHGVAGGA